MKRILALVLVAMMALAFTPAMAEKTVTIGMMLSDTANQFFVTMYEAAQAKAKELGVEVIVLDAANDAAKDVSNMEDLLSRGVNAILYNPVDSDAAPAVVELANKAGVPVITIDRSSNGGEVVSHIASDNVYGGKIAGEYIVSLLPDGGEIAEIQGQAGASAAKDRGEGFHQAVDTIANIKVVSSQIGNWDRTQALSIMENVMQANPNVKAVFCHNDVMALGVVEACQQAGRSDIIIVGFDADKDAIAAIQEGTMMATVQQLPDQMGIIGVQTAVDYLAGKTVEPKIGVQVALITKTAE
jgi:ribose transport system substrate-binding protein